MSFARGQARRRAPSTRALVVLAVLGLAVVATISAPAASADALSSEARPGQGRRGTPHGPRDRGRRRDRGLRRRSTRSSSNTRNAMRLNEQSLQGRAGEPEGGGDAARGQPHRDVQDRRRGRVLLPPRGPVDRRARRPDAGHAARERHQQDAAEPGDPLQGRGRPAQARLAKQLKAVQRPAGGIRRGQGAGAQAARQPAAGLHQQPEGLDPEDPRPSRRPPRQRAAEAAAGQGIGTTTTANLPAPPASTLGGQAVAIAEQYLGVPYVWGGASPSGFDCSGLVMYVYAQLGVSLPHNAAAQMSVLPARAAERSQPGDLVFFNGASATSGSTSAAAR